MKDVSEDLLLRDAEVRVVIVRVGTCVDDPIHVQVQVVKFRNLQHVQLISLPVLYFATGSAAKEHQKVHRTKG